MGIVEIQEKVGVLLGGGGFGPVGPNVVLGPTKNQATRVAICRDVTKDARGFALNPTGEAYSCTPPDLLAEFEAASRRGAMTANYRHASHTHTHTHTHTHITAAEYSLPT